METLKNAVTWLDFMRASVGMPLVYLSLRTEAKRVTPFDVACAIGKLNGLRTMQGKSNVRTRCLGLHDAKDTDRATRVQEMQNENYVKLGEHVTYLTRLHARTVEASKKNNKLAKKVTRLASQLERTQTMLAKYTLVCEGVMTWKEYKTWRKETSVQPASVQPASVQPASVQPSEQWQRERTETLNAALA